VEKSKKSTRKKKMDNDKKTLPEDMLLMILHFVLQISRPEMVYAMASVCKKWRHWISKFMDGSIGPKPNPSMNIDSPLYVERMLTTRTSKAEIKIALDLESNDYLDKLSRKQTFPRSKQIADLFRSCDPKNHIVINHWHGMLNGVCIESLSEDSKPSNWISKETYEAGHKLCSRRRGGRTRDFESGDGHIIDHRVLNNRRLIFISGNKHYCCRSVINYGENFRFMLSKHDKKKHISSMFVFWADAGPMINFSLRKGRIIDHEAQKIKQYFLDGTCLKIFNFKDHSITVYKHGTFKSPDLLNGGPIHKSFGTYRDGVLSSVLKWFDHSYTLNVYHNGSYVTSKTYDSDYVFRTMANMYDMYF
jgi:hypothetical protein